jgi:PAS domain S-box-containing protein
VHAILAVERTEIADLSEVLGNKSPVGVYIVQDEKFCYVNSSFQSFTGYKEDELPDRDYLEHVITEDRNMVSENAIGIY